MPVGVSRSLKETGTTNVGTQKMSKKSDSRPFKHSLTLGLLGRDLRPDREPLPQYIKRANKSLQALAHTGDRSYSSAL